MMTGTRVSTRRTASDPRLQPVGSRVVFRGRVGLEPTDEVVEKLTVTGISETGNSSRRHSATRIAILACYCRAAAEVSSLAGITISVERRRSI
jgi:hypothetical protein